MKNGKMEIGVVEILFWISKVDGKLKIKRSESKWVKRYLLSFQRVKFRGYKKYLNSYGVRTKEEMIGVLKVWVPLE